MLSTITQSAHLILLGSSSPYRGKLLSTLAFTFEQASPNIDERPNQDEDAKSLSLRLSKDKSKALVFNYPNHIIITSDQVALSANGQILEKPGSHNNAIAQLSVLSSTVATFYTSISVLSTIKPLSQNNLHTTEVSFDGLEAQYYQQSAVEKCEVKFRKLSPQEIRNYVKKENALDCAGSFKAESLGISLFEYIRSDDPNILIGLPLITTCSMLRNLGLSVL